MKIILAIIVVIVSLHFIYWLFYRRSLFLLCIFVYWGLAFLSAPLSQGVAIPFYVTCNSYLDTYRFLITLLTLFVIFLIIPTSLRGSRIYIKLYVVIVYLLLGLFVFK